MVMDDNMQGLSWNWDPQRLYQIKSCYYLSSTGSKSVCSWVLGLYFDMFAVPFVSQFDEVFLIHFRKDTYGVFSEPVDPKEVSVFK